MPKTNNGWIVCHGFQVHAIERKKGEPARFRMEAWDSKGNVYGLSTKNMNDRKELVAQILQAMCAWPDYNWEFLATKPTVGGGGTITDARPTST